MMLFSNSNRNKDEFYDLENGDRHAINNDTINIYNIYNDNIPKNTILYISAFNYCDDNVIITQGTDYIINSNVLTYLEKFKTENNTFNCGLNHVIDVINKHKL